MIIIGVLIKCLTDLHWEYVESDTEHVETGGKAQALSTSSNV